MKFFSYKKMCTLFLLLALCVLGVRGYGQTPPTKQWDRTFGTTSQETGERVAQLSNGNILLGSMSVGGINGDKSTANFGGGLNDIWVLSVDANGNKLWDKSYGTTGNDFLRSVGASPLGGFYLFVYDNGVDYNNTRTAATKGGQDYWVIKCDNNGNKLWDKVYGGTDVEQTEWGIATSDGGFLVGGKSRSPISGDKTEPRLNTAQPTYYDIWIVKCDSAGTKQWDKTIGVTENSESLKTMVETPSGFVIGTTVVAPASGMLTEPSFGSQDAWILNLNKANGSLIWQKRLGSTLSDDPRGIAPTNDGGVMVALQEPAGISATGGDKTGTTSYGSYDFWVIKLDANGQKVWSKLFGSAAEEIGQGLIPFTDGYIIHGLLTTTTTTSAPSGLRTETGRGQGDFWMIKIDDNGNKLWDKTFGSAGHDYWVGPEAWKSAIRLTDGSIAIHVTTEGAPADGSFDQTKKSRGLQDNWLLKTQPPLQADLAVTVSPATATGNKGENLSYTVTVTNNGPSTAPNATVRVPIPNGRTFLSATPSAGTYSSGTKVWTVGSLVNGASATMTLIIKVN